MPNVENTNKIQNIHAKARDKFFGELIKFLERGVLTDDLLSEVNDASCLVKDYYMVLFPDGKQEVAKLFEQWMDQQMLSILSQQKKPLKVREQIAAALICRIINIVPKQVMLNQSSFFLLPENIVIGAETACHTCDEIWCYAGDKSTDFNYYTKRGLLLSVYLSAKTYYFADNSQDHEKTKEFIKDGLDNIINIASLKNRISLPDPENIPILRLFL